jgi:hypothetical protein
MGTFVVQTLPGRDEVALARFLSQMSKLLLAAQAAGLDTDDIEAIYRTAIRNAFAEGVA